MLSLSQAANAANRNITAAVSKRSAKPSSLLPLILEPGQLAASLPNIQSYKFLLLDLRDEDAYTAGHLPNALWLNYQSLVKGGETASGLLPEARKLSALFSSIGLTHEHHVIAYDQDAGAAASRLLWTLDVIGHKNFSLLNGGYSGWLDGKHTVTCNTNNPEPSNYIAKPGTQGVVTKEQVLSKIGDDNVVLLDTRLPKEHSGALLRAARGGHIPGSINMNWTEATDPAKRSRLRQPAALEQLLAGKGVKRHKEIIPYCQTHHRSSHTYIMLKHMGFENVNAYAGSWSEWGNLPGLPIISLTTSEN